MFNMFRSSQQRNSRYKDFNVKRALQICVLLGVCIWMVYLVQHSREKKRSYGEGTKADSEVVKLGRKDPHPIVEQSSIIDERDKEEKDDEEHKHGNQNKTDNVDGVDHEILMQKNEQNNNEENFEHRKDPVDRDTEESSVTIRERQEKEHKTNKESDSVVKEDNQTREIGEEKRETEKEETDDKENKDINQNRSEAKEHMKESNATENDQIQELDSSEHRVQDQNSERNNEEAKEENYASNEVLNKTKQSDKRENNEFELESQTNGTEVAHVHQNERVLNVTHSVVTMTNQGNSSKHQAKKKNDSQKSFIVESDKQEQEPNKPSSDDEESLHSHNGTDITSNATEKQLEKSENSKVEDSILLNKTLKTKDLKPDAAVEQVDLILTNSSRAHERNVTNGEYNGKVNANDNGHVGQDSASDSSIAEGKDTSSKNNDAGQDENGNIDTSENEDRAQNEPVESQKENEESAH